MEVQHRESGSSRKTYFRLAFKSKLVQTMIDLGLTKEVDIDIGKVFNGKNMKNMSLISLVIDPSEPLDRNAVAYKRISVDDYPIFTKEDPLEILESYIAYCLATCVIPIVYSYDELPENAPDVYSLKRKRKSKKMGDGPSGTVKSLQPRWPRPL